MCVQKRGLAFEGPTQKSDFAILSSAYPGIDFAGLNAAMSVHGFMPLAVDLAVIGAAMSITPDAWGVSFLPFAGVRSPDMAMVKLADMDGIVEWAENSALGTDMWRAASDYLAEHHNVEIRFTMDCGCGVVQSRAVDNGSWYEWLRHFNSVRRDIFGRTNVIWLEDNSIARTDITPEQQQAWAKMRSVLLSLSPRVAINDKMANAA